MAQSCITITTIKAEQGYMQRKWKLQALMNWIVVIPNVHRLMSPVIEVAYNIQATHDNINLKRVDTISSGLW